MPDSSRNKLDLYDMIYESRFQRLWGTILRLRSPRPDATHRHAYPPQLTTLYRPPRLCRPCPSAGIAGVVAAAVDEASSYQILAMCNAFPAFVYGGLGVHPERSVADDETTRVIA